MTISKNRESNNSQDRQNKATAKSSKAPPVNKRPEDALHASETVTLFNAGDPGLITSPMDPQDFTLVLNKFKIDTWLVESVQAHFDEVLPYLLQGSEYTWQELLGEDFFADVAVPRHLPLLCLKHLAQQPDSQLTVVPLTGCDTTYFEIN